MQPKMCDQDLLEKDLHLFLYFDSKNKYQNLLQTMKII